MKNLFLLVFLLLFFSNNTAFGQFYKDVRRVQPYKERLDKVDELLKLNPYESIILLDQLEIEARETKNIELSIVCDIYRGTYYYYTGNNDSSLVFFDRAIIHAEKIRNHQLNSSASIRRLFVIDDRVESSIMFDLMQEEYLIALEFKDTLNMLYSLNGLGSYASDLDSVENSYQFYIQAIELAKESGNEFEHGFLLNNFGLLKLKLNAPEEAFDELKKGMKIAQKLKNVRLELIIRDNYGYYYNVVDSTEKAREQYEYALEVAKEKNYPLIELIAMINLSEIERRQGNTLISDSILMQSLYIAKEKHVYNFIPFIYLEQATLLLEKKEYELVEEMIDSALIYAKYSSKGDIFPMYYDIKYQMYKDKGDYKTALDYYIRKSEFVDSLNNETHLQVMTLIQLKYDVEKKEIQRVKEKLSFEHKIRQKEEDEARMTKWLLIIAFSFLLSLSFGLVFYFRNKNKQEAKFSSAMINQLEKERERIATDLHDGIGQSLIIIKNKLNNLNIETSEKYNDLNDDISKTLESVRGISRSLIPPELKRLGLHKSIDKMLNQVADSVGIVVSSDLDFLDEISLDKTHEIRIYRIIQELITNTIKHSKASSLRVEFKGSSNGYSIIYQDNGIGIDEEAIDEGNSVGLRSIRSRLKMINGTIKYEKQEKGLKAIIKIKLR